MGKYSLRAVALILILALTLCQTACKKRNADESGVARAVVASVAVAVSLPGGSDRWREVGGTVAGVLKSKGYAVDMDFAEDVSGQSLQISQMLSRGCELLAVFPINAYAMSNALEEAKQRGVPVVACGSLIMGTDAVDYLVAFDDVAAGRLQGERFAETVSVNSTKRRFNIEIFPGDLETAPESGVDYFNGLIGALEPYLDSNKVQIFSNETAPERMSVPETESEPARRRMSGLISSCGYGPGKISLDAVFCKNDVMARGVVQALIEAGYGEGDMPFVVGRGCDSENVDLISRGLQTMSLYDDADVLAEALNEAISDALGIEAYEPNADADNGEKTVPAFLCEPVICDAANYATLLVDK